MSTRATYKFTGKHAATTTIYIHHDGYESGAAGYFYNMLLEKRGSGAAAFIRANDGAEITTSHETHSDSEYRYDLHNSGTEAELKVRMRGGADYDEWKVIYFGHLRGFIEANTEFLPDDFEPFVEVPPSSPHYGKSVWMNNHLHAPLDHAMHHLRIWAEKGTCIPGHGNWSCSDGDATRIATAMGMEGILTELVELRAKALKNHAAKAVAKS